jgi:hypothetical protein
MERGSFGLDAFGGSGVPAADDLADEAAIAGEVRIPTRAATCSNLVPATIAT